MKQFCVLVRTVKDNFEISLQRVIVFKCIGISRVDLAFLINFQSVYNRVLLNFVNIDLCCKNLDGGGEG